MCDSRARRVSRHTSCLTVRGGGFCVKAELSQCSACVCLPIGRLPAVMSLRQHSCSPEPIAASLRLAEGRAWGRRAQFLPAVSFFSSFLSSLGCEKPPPPSPPHLRSGLPQTKQKSRCDRKRPWAKVRVRPLDGLAGGEDQTGIRLLADSRYQPDRWLEGTRVGVGAEGREGRPGRVQSLQTYTKDKAFGKWFRGSQPELAPRSAV